MTKKMYSFRVKEQGPNKWITEVIYAHNVEEARDILTNTYLLRYDIGYHYIWCLFVKCNENYIWKGVSRIREIDFSK